MMHKEPSSKIQRRIARFCSTFHKIWFHSDGNAIFYQQMVETTMRYWTSRFDFIVMEIQESRDVKTMKIEQLWGSLETHELMVIDRWTDRSIQQFLQTQMVKKYKHERKYNKKGGGFCINQSTKNLWLWEVLTLY